jgi:hypothetical protein
MIRRLNGSDDRSVESGSLAATLQIAGLSIDPILVVAQTLNICHILAENSYIVNFG